MTFSGLTGRDQRPKLRMCSMLGSPKKHESRAYPMSSIGTGESIGHPIGPSIEPDQAPRATRGDARASRLSSRRSASRRRLRVARWPQSICSSSQRASSSPKSASGSRGTRSTGFTQAPGWSAPDKPRPAGSGGPTPPTTSTAPNSASSSAPTPRVTEPGRKPLLNSAPSGSHSSETRLPKACRSPMNQRSAP